MLLSISRHISSLATRCHDHHAREHLNCIGRLKTSSLSQFALRAIASENFLRAQDSLPPLSRTIVVTEIVRKGSNKKLEHAL